MRVLSLLALLPAVGAFIIPAPLQSKGVAQCQTRSRVQVTAMMSDRAMRSARKPGPNDRVVELNKPLGIVLEEDEKGNVYVKELSPAGNAARSGKVNKGDLVTMISATFGDEVWSARGAGLGMIMQAIKVRQGNTVKIVLEAPKTVKKPAKPMFNAPKKPAAPAKPQKSQEELLKQLEAEEKGKKRFLGLF